MIDFKKFGSDIQVHKLNDEELHNLIRFIKNPASLRNLVQEMDKRNERIFNSKQIKKGDCYFRKEVGQYTKYYRVDEIDDSNLTVSIILMHNDHDIDMYSDIWLNMDFYDEVITDCESFDVDKFNRLEKMINKLNEDVTEVYEKLFVEYNKMIGNE